MAKVVKLQDIADEHGSYAVEAYAFVAEGLRRSGELTGKEEREGEERHLTATELVAGVLHLAEERYGLLAGKVLAGWGVLSSDDVGAITYHLIDAGLLGAHPRDRREDFAHGPIFTTAVKELVRRRLEVGHGS